MKNRLTNFLEKRSLLSENQYEFRLCKSTITVLTNIVTKIINAFDNGQRLPYVI